MRHTRSLLQGLRFIDSFFPSGGYAYSSGLEAAVQARAVRSGDDLSLYVQDVFRRGIAHREAVAVAVAHDASAHIDLQPALAIDHELHAMKVGQESRMASQQMGWQISRIAVERLDAGAVVQEFCSAIEAERTPGHFPVALALTLADAGWGKTETIAAFCYHTAVGYVSAGLKLLPIGQREGQHLLESWMPLLDECTGLAADSSTMSGWSPIQDIYAMRHSRLESRLFRS